MSKYLLTCECGKKLPVETSQSGTEVPCACGRSVEVPTLRELSRMKTAPERRGTVERPWDWRQAVAFLGILIVLGAAALAAYMQFNRVKVVDYEAVRREGDELTVHGAWLRWTVLRNFGIGLNVPRHMVDEDEKNNPYPDPVLIGAAYEIKQSLRKVERDLAGDNEALQWIYIAGGIVVIGGVLMAVSYLWPSASGAPIKKHRARPRSAT